MEWKYVLDTLCIRTYSHAATAICHHHAVIKLAELVVGNYIAVNIYVIRNYHRAVSNIAP
jgi:hypothetical protein